MQRLTLQISLLHKNKLITVIRSKFRNIVGNQLVILIERYNQFKQVNSLISSFKFHARRKMKGVVLICE